MASPVPNHDVGIVNSRTKRTAQSVEHANMMLAALLQCNRDGTGGKTYRELAEHFNALELPTARGGGAKWDAPLVHKLLNKLGIYGGRAGRRRYENNMRLALEEGRDYRAESSAKLEASIAARRARMIAEGLDPDAPRDLEREPPVWTP